MLAGSVTGRTTIGLGFERGALVFAGLLALVAAAHFWLKNIPPSVLFWSAYILTRPLGATLGETLTKPYAEGGLPLGRIASSFTIAALMVVGIILMSRWTQQAVYSSNRGRR